jgi:hypothetical protein
MTIVKLMLIDLSEDCMSYIPTSTRCALTHAQWGGHSNTHSYCDAIMQVDAVEKAPQIEVSSVRSSKMLGNWNRSEYVDAKISAVFGKAKHNEVWKEVRSCGVEMLIGVQPKHEFTLFYFG